MRACWRAARIATVPLAIGFAVLTGCRSSAGAAAGAGAERVVGVSKQLNEFLYAIGAESILVARDLTSIYPPAIRSLPTVGYHRALSAEGIIAARPTLLLTDGNVGPEPVLEQVRKVGIPVLVLGAGGTVDSAQQLLAALGARFHRERAADSVLQQWKAGMAEVRADSARLNQLPRPRVLVMHFGQLVNGYLAVNRGGPADQMITWAGGANAIDSVGGMTRLTPELIAKAAPDVIVATDVGFDRVGNAASFAALPGVALTPAAKAGRIYRIDETELIYFGPRTPATVRKLASMFHP
jgi:iron complex transport system substrate-binding protein